MLEAVDGQILALDGASVGMLPWHLRVPGHGTRRYVCDLAHAASRRARVLRGHTIEPLP
ncbi:hypothetical protein JHN63_34185 [Streptomyces sp. MBT65]|uniref:hypothetical protein n=1 Tax=Streptomyces sp. MBT65 TaxID=1488395 RepID=UPI00190D09FA|nr:hypothetical protein [Streptomyces sp. MBT65]MBK3578762.1 hypothetical protein [Streptomyces sp. MBT65]